MALRITIGQYYHADSPVHRLDPRAKLVCALVLMVTVILIVTPAQLVLGMAFVAAVVAIARLPLARVLESIKPLVVILAILGLFNLFYVHTGTVMLSLGPVAITDEAVWWAVCYTLRLSVALLYGALVLLTTTQVQLADAFDAALAPVSRLGGPGHELAMVFALMLRFIPTIADEASAIIDAQTARGGGPGEGGFTHRVQSIGPLLVALLGSAARHADGVARALDARCYEGAATRSHWHPLRFGAGDAFAAALTVAYLVALCLLA